MTATPRACKVPLDAVPARRAARSAGAVCTLGALAATASSRSAAAAANDLSIQVGFGKRGTIDPGTTTPPAFSLSVIVSGPAPEPVTIVVELPDGLRWKSAPSPTEGCIGTTRVVCKGALESGSGGAFAYWSWGVVADKPGSYEIRAAITSSDQDPNTSNNSAAFQFEVVKPGGGSGSVRASAVKLSPANPKAGSTLVASVGVTKGGSPLKPTRIACAASIGATKVKGGPKSSSGLASCLFRTPKSGKGQMMLGSISFTAGGQSLTKRFATKLR